MSSRLSSDDYLTAAVLIDQIAGVLQKTLNLFNVYGCFACISVHAVLVEAGRGHLIRGVPRTAVSSCVGSGN